jgi:hypothetical protein
MRPAAALAAGLAAAWLAGPAPAQTVTTPGQDGVIQMQPLNALKPQPVVPGVGAQQPPQDQTQPGLLLPGQPSQPGQLGQPAAGQDTTTGPIAPPVVPGQTTTTTTTADVAAAPGAVLRWLDKISGDTVDLTLKDGQSKTEGRLTITLADCRYPVGDPASNAFAFLTIHDKLVSKPIFKGWMIASSPALNPLDSARYDVWVLRCTNS